jgi:hypothetical protein
MKVRGDMLEDWRDTEVFQEDGRIMMRTKSFVERKQQWVLENLEVASAKHSFEKDWKKALRELAKDTGRDDPKPALTPRSSVVALWGAIPSC